MADNEEQPETESDDAPNDDDDTEVTEDRVQEAIEPTPLKQTKPRRLTLKQQAFVQNYANPSAETFGNGRRAVLAIPGRKGKSVNGASVQAHEYLQNPNLISQIEQTATKAGLGDMFRFRTLHDIASGRYVRRVTRDPDTGETLETPKAAEIIKALDVVNKMTGLYEKNRVIANATSSRFKELARAFRPKLAQVKPAKTKRVGVDTVHKRIQVKVDSEHSWSMSFWPIVLELDSTHAAALEQGSA